ncbi:MAG: hypothetical protein ACO4CT_07100 [Planctomycetota bacterium]
METRRKQRALWALIVSVALAFVPGVGAVLCMERDGSAHFGLGLDCPCPDLPDGTHPPCTDVALEGLRDLVPDTVPLPTLDFAGWLDLLALVPCTFRGLADDRSPEARAGPPWDSARAGRPDLARAFGHRATTVLLI